jgi:hypothetical protein
MLPSVSPAWHWPVNWISDRSKERSSAWRTSLLLSRLAEGLRRHGGHRFYPKKRAHPVSAIISNLFVSKPDQFPALLDHKHRRAAGEVYEFLPATKPRRQPCHRTRKTTSLCSSAWENGLLYLQCKSVQGFSFRTAGFPQYGWKAGISVRHRSSGCARTRLSNQNLSRAWPPNPTSVR